MTWAAFFPTVPASLWQTAKTTRGFTGHEQLDEVGLVHMNGRVYDPELGRFLSADPVVQDATDLQAFNHYAYVRNNPLSLLDPSGFFLLGGIFSAIGHFFSGIFRSIGNASRQSSIILSSGLCSYRSLHSGAWHRLRHSRGCLDTSGRRNAAAGAGGDGLRGRRPFIWTNVGQMLRAEGLATNFLAKGLVHGVVGGALSVARGGSFMQGFASNAIGAEAGLMSNAISGGNVILDTALVGAAGGAASVLTGGKFENGFITAAFANLFNKFNWLGGSFNLRSTLMSSSTFTMMHNCIDKYGEYTLEGTDHYVGQGGGDTKYAGTDSAWSLVNFVENSLVQYLSINGTSFMMQSDNQITARGWS